MGTLDLPHASSFKDQGGSETFLRDVLESILKTYLRKNPMAKTVWELVQSVDNEKISYDHFFFRTFKVDGYGIESLSSFFMDYGYKIGGRLEFPKNKVQLVWLSPPDIHVSGDGHGLGNGPLPRLVIAELLVDELSLESQEIIRKYLKPEGGKQAILSSTLGSLIWEKPTSAEFNQLVKESEYAAWALIHGYTLNHLAVAVHRLKHRFSDINYVQEYFQENGFKLNKVGGDILNESEDGLLLQVTLASEKVAIEFADGVTEPITASFIEFVQRLVLPQFKDVPIDEIKEFHRREGLEQANANRIMQSTLSQHKNETN
ncbi:uncharacterized protein LOC111200115 isoform X1 [Brassica napus]|uniref:uncharacterized protein LOC111200115 isoform X1 n=1 Tax=Brassica napus TaxID=3708 RepID=UPI002078E6D8|nr:uncharacterized protein LOC111200115 isoform X1 [Brassica napus]